MRTSLAVIQYIPFYFILSKVHDLLLMFGNFTEYFLQKEEKSGKFPSNEVEYFPI